MIGPKVKPGMVKTLEGNSLTVTSINCVVKVDKANLTKTDILADNGLIHIIDTVVMPKK